MAAALHTPHKPDAVVVCYAALCVQSALSSSRLLALCDLMLPFTVLLTCLDAYTGPEGVPSISSVSIVFAVSRCAL